MATAFGRLFEPGRIGKLEIRNKIAMAPMGTALAELDGRYSRRQIDYYSERARGGAGLLIIEAAKVETQVEPPPVFPSTLANSDGLVPAMADLADAVHGYGAKVAMQLTPGLGRQAFVDPKRPPVSASAVPAFADPSVICHALTHEEIAAIVQAFAMAVGRAAMAGFDAVEIHGHTGYLLDQFLSSLWNKRTDEYGGDLDGRMLFARELMEASRKRVGPDFPITFRLSAVQCIPGGRGIEEAQEIARKLEAMGVDAIHVDAGAYEAIDYIFPPVYLGDAPFADLAGAIKQVVGIPVIAVGNMTPETAEATLASGKADFIALGRSLIADPDWPNKVRRGQLEDLRPCIRCNEQCIGRLFALKTVSCAVNARAGSERYYELRKADLVKEVLVIGGGPAGMEAARVASLRGHRVTLVERDRALGGQLRAAGSSPFKKELRQMIDWWATQLRKQQVDVRLGAEATPETLGLMQADSVVVACGAKPLHPPIPGIDGENVVQVMDYHLGRKPLRGQRIVIAGGGLSGCDAAIEMANEGKAVTILEMLDEVARDLNSVSRVSLLRLLGEKGIKTLTGHRVKEFRTDSVLVEGPDGKETTLDADTAVVALGARPENGLVQAVKDRWDQVFVIGDCVKTGKVGEAVRDGFETGWHL